MHSAAVPARADLMLVGGGHAHVGVLRAFAMAPEPGLRLTLVAKELEAPYSGMLPGYVAGAYTREQVHIDLARLAAAAGARLIHGAATGLDLGARRLRIGGRPDLGFDFLSIDVGVTPRLDGIEGAAEHAIPVKPVSLFADRWDALRRAATAPDGPRRIAVIGGGAAGFELILAAAARLRAEAEDDRAFSFTLIAGGALLQGFPDRARARAAAALARAHVDLIEHDPAVARTASEIRLASGRTLPAEAALIAAEAQAPAWFAETGLALDPRGYLAVAPSLRSLSHERVFAAGDCAGVEGHPRPKAGVFAVRQAKPLTDNLRRAHRGEALRDFTPQRRFLSLLSTADGSAIASRAPVTAEGSWVWRWKDRIDRAFMERHRLAPMGRDDAEMRCGGCAAKIGPMSLARALDRLAPGRPAGDDAAVIDEGGPRLRLESVDFFRAFWPDPWLLGRIAANHALGDLFAMGARPETAQAIIALPYAAPRLREEDLFQMTAGAASILEREGARLIGGHSSEGAEAAIGLAVSGSAPREALLSKGGLRPGDRLLLTRPIGAGVIFAAAMRGRAPAAAIDGALERMQASHAGPAAALIDQGVRAATDVTGFGLAGHLLEMLAAADLEAEIDLGAVPLLPGALDLVRAGVASTLLAENLALADDVLDPSDAAPSAQAVALLFDPQTAGPLLAGAPADRADACLAAIRDAGAPEAALIGTIKPRLEPDAARLLISGAFGD